MSFRKYDHVERLGHPEVQDIDVGLIHVFPKLDGTNASVWCELDGMRVRCGSRNRVLDPGSDNHGFCTWVLGDDPKAKLLREFVETNPHLIVYGEWLVPHSLKTYRQDAWKRFWIFDVWHRGSGEYLPFDSYAPKMEGLDLILPLCTAENPSANQLREIMERNTFLLQDGAGAGEGIVLKNYLWRNKFGRQPWAKIVTNEFKEKNGAAFGPRHVKGERDIAAEIVAELATESFIRKEWTKVVNLVANEQRRPTFADEDEEHGFVQANRHRIIPRFLGTLYYEFVQEEIREIVKKWKNPVLDFGRLNKLLTLRAKEVMREVF